MADVQQAVDVVLRQEDSTLSGVVTNEASDCGGLTRFGLCAKYHAALQTAGFYNPTQVPQAQALQMAEQTYATEYGTPLMLAQINDQGLATALLSFAVNDSQHQAVVLLQQAVNACGGSLKTDGAMGPATLAAVNAADPRQLVSQLCNQQNAYYQSIVAKNPSQQVFLKGWQNRVANVMTVCNA